MIDNPAVGSIYQSIKEYIPIISLVTAGISALIAIISLKRTNIYQKYDYSTRIQVSNERIAYGSPTSPSVRFQYNANIQNNGLKPVEIIIVNMLCGQLGDKANCDVYTLKGNCYLRPGDSVDIEFIITNDKINDILKRRSIKNVDIMLNVKYRDIKGNIKETTRLVGGIQENMGSVIVLHQGEILR